MPVLRFVRTRLSYANVAATLALVLAMAGTGYAAFVLPANSVGSRQIRNGAVGRSELRRGAVNSSRVARNSLTGANISERSLGTVPKARYSPFSGRARNADRVGGVTAQSLRVMCPAGTILDTGGCMEQAARPSLAFQAAAAACTDGRTLPTVAQLTGFAQGRGLSGVELTGDLASAGSVYTVDLATGSIGTASTASPMPFRCLTDPGN